MTEANQEYKLRLEQEQQKIQKYSRTDKFLSTIRGILFVIFVFLLFYILNSEQSYLWIGVPAVLFVIVVVVHEQLINRKNLASRIASFYERGLARLENRWMGTGTDGKDFKDSTHPYSEDLDLFGSGSLFELLCIARTRRTNACGLALESGRTFARSSQTICSRRSSFPAGFS